MTVLVGATIPAYLAEQPRTSLAWLDSAERMSEQSNVEFFATLETDGRGLDPFQQVTRRLEGLGGSWWSFSIDTGEEEITTQNRLSRICAGRNLIIDRALADAECSHVLFLDADVQVPADSVERLLSLDWPIVGGNVPSYCLDGPRLRWEQRDNGWYGHLPHGHMPLEGETVGPFPHRRDLREHWNTAAVLLVARELFRVVRWGYDDVDGGQSDDPWFAERCRMLGWPTIVDHDLSCAHTPLVPLEARGLDRRWLRT